jgi:allophanate hydrolase
LFETAALLYQGPWVAERYHAIRALIESRPEALYPVTRDIIGAGASISGVDTFDGLYRLAGLKRQADEILEGLDALVVPTAPTIWRHDQVEADPIGTNSLLGTYTIFVNLLVLAALAVPAGFRPDGLPFGITLIAPAGSDRMLLSLGARFAGEPWVIAPGPAGDRIEIAVCGAHMAGLPLNGELLRRGGRMVQACRTSPDYRLFALNGGPPARPGLVRTPGGAAIEVEVWSLPATRVGDFLRKVPAPLSIGSVELEHGDKALGFLCEAYAASDAADITAYGGWRRYLAEAAQTACPA